MITPFAHLNRICVTSSSGNGNTTLPNKPDFIIGPATSRPTCYGSISRTYPLAGILNILVNLIDIE
ncbi:hypothetical protein [Chitinophaga sp.]|uniref:hypothetical protein n=1 Tax=Chitinophaga sp. TaxID=1869181 RepID=UPI0031D27F72